MSKFKNYKFNIELKKLLKFEIKKHKDHPLPLAFGIQKFSYEEVQWCYLFYIFIQHYSTFSRPPFLLPQISLYKVIEKAFSFKFKYYYSYHIHHALDTVRIRKVVKIIQQYSYKRHYIIQSFSYLNIVKVDVKKGN